MNLHSQRLSAALLSGGVSNGDIYQAALEAARRHKPDARRILDFGSGTGSFIEPLRTVYSGASVAGADIMARPAGLPSSVDWYECDLNNAQEIPSGEFDLVFAIEVIEHLENPRQVLRELYRIMAPGGIAVMTTPNTGSMRSLITFIFRGHHTYFDDANYPAHITAVTELDFKRAGTEAGFEAPDFFYTDVGIVPKLLKLKWQKIPLVGGIFKGKRFSDNFGAAFLKR